MTQTGGLKPPPTWVCCKAGWTLEQWSFYRYQLHLGWMYTVGLLFVNLYFYIFIQQRFRAGRAMNSSPAASLSRQTVRKPKSTLGESSV